MRLKTRDSDGAALCAKEGSAPPSRYAPTSALMSNAPAAVACGMTCTGDHQCQHFNYVTTDSQHPCHLYYYSPTDFDVEPNCMHYETPGIRHHTNNISCFATSIKPLVQLKLASGYQKYIENREQEKEEEQKEKEGEREGEGVRLSYWVVLYFAGLPSLSDRGDKLTICCHFPVTLNLPLGLEVHPYLLGLFVEPNVNYICKNFNTTAVFPFSVPSIYMLT